MLSLHAGSALKLIFMCLSTVQITDMRVPKKGKNRGKTEFFVIWSGYDRDDGNWEPEEHLDAEMVADFRKVRWQCLT